MIGTTNKPAKMENEIIESGETPTDEENSISTEEISGDSFSGELNAPQWSVVSFEKCVAGNLTYAAASDKLNELHARKVSGLCIVTDEAAGRIEHSIND